MGSAGLLNTRGVSVTAGGCSACGTGTGSLGLVCGAGDCCTGGFSSAISGAGVACASIDALVRLLRCTGCTLASLDSLDSAGLRGFLGFFSGSGAFGSFGLGFGPGFLRGWPDAVRPLGAGDVFAGVGVLAPPTPGTRIVEFGVPCSGECGGELRLPGEDASLASMAGTPKWPVPKTLQHAGPLYTEVESCVKTRDMSNAIRAQIARMLGFAPNVALGALQTQLQKLRVASSARELRTPKSACGRWTGPGAPSK